MKKIFMKLTTVFLFLFVAFSIYSFFLSEITNAESQASLISLPSSGLDISNGTVEVINSTTVVQNDISYQISDKQKLSISGTSTNNYNIKISDDVGEVTLLLNNVEINTNEINAIDIGRNNNVGIILQDNSNNVLSGNYAVYAGINSSVSLKGKANLTCNGILEAIYSKIDINISDATVNAKSADIIDSVAICAIHAVNISGEGTVINAEGYEDAIYAGNSIQIDSAELNLTATHDAYDDGSVHCYFGDIKIRKSTLKAVCKDDGSCYGGIGARSGSISIEDSNIESFGKKFALDSKNGINLIQKGYNCFEGNEYGFDKSNFSSSILSNDKTHTNKKYIAIVPKLSYVNLKSEGMKDTRATVSYGDTKLSVNSIETKKGYIIKGFYAEEQYNTLVADEKGNLNASASVYTDADSKWICEDGTVNLYIRWQKEINIPLFIITILALVIILFSVLFALKNKNIKNKIANKIKVFSKESLRIFSSIIKKTLRK